MSFTDRQLRAMALSPKFAASLSLPGSLFIIYETIQDYRQGLGSTATHRALLGMSVVDVLSSIGWFLSTWMAPVESGAFYAEGNAATCSFQGFLLQVAIGAPMYNGALVLFYLLVIKYKWTDRDIFTIEKFVHVFIWAWCIGTSIAILVMDLFHFIGPVCWISDPAECWEETPDPTIKCNRAKKYSTALFCVPLWICISLTIYALFAIYLEVRQTTLRLMRYSLTGTDINSRRRSSSDVRNVALRAVMYSVAFVITWTASTVWSVAQWFDYYPFWVSYLWTLFEPLQGCWNCLIFLHNRPQSQEKIKRWLGCILCCCGRPAWRGGASATNASVKRSTRTTVGASSNSNGGVNIVSASTDHVVSATEHVSSTEHVPAASKVGSMTQRAYVEQTVLGWNVLFRGFWSKSWSIAQQLYYTEKEEEQLTGDIWVSRVMTFLLESLFEPLWEIRNKSQHGDDPAEQRLIRSNKADRTIRRLWEKCQLLPYQDRRVVCHSSLEQLLVMTLFERQTWIDMTTKFLPKARARQRARAKDQRAITEFFDCIPRRQA